LPSPKILHWNESKTRKKSINTSHALDHDIKRRTLFKFQSYSYEVDATLYVQSTFVLLNYLLSISVFVFAGVMIGLILRQFLDAAPILNSGTQRKVTEGKIF